MPLNQALLAELDIEMGKTRRVLERVPLEKSDWAPHPKSIKLGRLAQHVAEIAGWLVPTLQQDELSMDGYQPGPLLRSQAELLAAFDRNVAAARAALTAASDDAAFGKTWTKDLDAQVWRQGRVFGAACRGGARLRLQPHRSPPPASSAYTCASTTSPCPRSTVPQSAALILQPISTVWSISVP